MAEDQFEKVWGRLAAKTQGDLKEVVRLCRGACERALTSAAGLEFTTGGEDDINGMD